MFTHVLVQHPQTSFQILFGCSELRPWSWPKTSSWTLLVAWLGDGSHDMSVNLGQANVTKLPMSCFPSATAAWSALAERSFSVIQGQIFHRHPQKKGRRPWKNSPSKTPENSGGFWFFYLMLMSVSDAQRYYRWSEESPGVRCSFDLAHLPQRSQRLAS